MAEATFGSDQRTCEKVKNILGKRNTFASKLRMSVGHGVLLLGDFTLFLQMTRDDLSRRVWHHFYTHSSPFSSQPSANSTIYFSFKWTSNFKSVILALGMKIMHVVRGYKIHLFWRHNLTSQRIVFTPPSCQPSRICSQRSHHGISSTKVLSLWKYLWLSKLHDFGQP